MELMSDLDDEITPVFEEARILAINAKHGFVTLEHFFVAMLYTDCQANSWLTAFDVEEQITWLQKQYPEASTVAMEEDKMLLTLHAERIIHHARYMAFLKKGGRANSLHLLLAMLSYDNRVSDQAKKGGLIFEDIEQDFPRTPIQLKLRRFSKPSRIATFFGAAPSMEDLQEDIYDHAEELWTYQQYDHCITTCQTGLEFIPADHDLKILLADSLTMKKDYKNALTYYKELTDVFPDDPGLQLSLSYSYYRNGDHLRAGEILDNELVKYPDNDNILNNKGFNLAEQGKYAEAAPFYEKAIHINPSFAYPWDNLGFVRYKLGDTEQALELIDKSLELDKGNSYAYKYKGIIFMEQGNIAQAMENFSLALKYRYTETYDEEVLKLIEKIEPR